MAVQAQMEDGFAGLRIHVCPTGQEGITGFYKNGQYYFIVFFSEQQAQAIYKEYRHCLDLQRRIDFKQMVYGDELGLPKTSINRPIIITGSAGETLYKRFRRLAQLGGEDVGYEGLRCRVVKFLYTALSDPNTAPDPNAIIALKHQEQQYIVYIVYSCTEVMSILERHPEAKPDLYYYRQILSKSSLPAESDKQTIVIGDELGSGGIAAREICIAMDLS